MPIAALSFYQQNLSFLRKFLGAKRRSIIHRKRLIGKANLRSSVTFILRSILRS